MSEAGFSTVELLERSSFLAKLQRRRLAPSRWQDLLRAARGEKPPRAPDPWDCCGSACKPCVKELYREEMRVWSEVHPDGPNEEEDGEGGEKTPALDESDEEERASPKVEIEVESGALELKDVQKSRGDVKEPLGDW